MMHFTYSIENKHKNFDWPQYTLTQLQKLKNFPKYETLTKMHTTLVTKLKNKQ